MTTDPMKALAKAYELTHMEDQWNPDRICSYCSHPRNSDECQFSAKHSPRVSAYRK